MTLISSPHAVQSRLLLETVIHSFVRVLPHTLGLGWWDRFWGCKSGVPTLASLSSNRRVCSHFMPPSEHRGLWILESTYISNSNGPELHGVEWLLGPGSPALSSSSCSTLTLSTAATILFYEHSNPIIPRKLANYSGDTYSLFFELPIILFFPRIISASLVPVLKYELTVSVQ